MACSGYQMCFKLNGVKHCICIPYLVEIDWRLIPDPGPLKRRFIETTLLTRDDVKHIQILAKISDLAKELPRDIGQQIHKGVSTQMHTYNTKLGGAMEIVEFGEVEGRTDAV